MPERADTLEAIGQIIFAPLLYSMVPISLYGLRRRKNCGLFVAGRVTDLLVPSLVMPAAFVTQLGGGARVPACSNAKLAVSADGQETIIPPCAPCGMPEGRIESVGRVSR